MARQPGCGKWIWDDATQNLCFTGKPAKPKSSLGKMSNVSESSTTVTLENIKAVAVDLISAQLVKEMNVGAAKLFDKLYMGSELDCFLVATLLYFGSFLECRRVSDEEKEAMSSSGPEAAEKAREELHRTHMRAEQAKVSLSHVYTNLVLGNSLPKMHHTMQGRLKNSRKQLDRQLFEAILEFAMYVVWVTFEYSHWELIHQELGRIFRTAAFNKDIDTPSAHGTSAQLQRRSNDAHSRYISYKVYFDRPPVGQLKELHSQAIIDVLSPPEDTNYLPPQSVSGLRVGIIGEPTSHFVAQSLRRRKTSSSDSPGEEDTNTNTRLLSPEDGNGGGGGAEGDLELGIVEDDAIVDSEW